MAHRTEKMLTFASLIKHTVKDTGEQPDEEVHRAKNAGCYLPGALHGDQPGRSLDHTLLGFLWRLCCVGMSSH